MSDVMSLVEHHAAILRQYDDAVPALRSLGTALRADLAGWLEAEPQLKVHSVTLRLKTRESLAAKLARPDRSYKQLWDVTDLLGLRVITYFEDAVDRVAEILERRLAVALEHSVDRRRKDDASAFGYRSVPLRLPRRRQRGAGRWTPGFRVLRGTGAHGPRARLGGDRA